MKNETTKIGIACFVGGLVGTAVAVTVMMSFWWMGLIAGAVAGYISYEFRAVLRAIPRAWKATVENGPEFGLALFQLLGYSLKFIFVTVLWRGTLVLATIILAIIISYTLPIPEGESRIFHLALSFVASVLLVGFFVALACVFVGIIKHFSRKNGRKLDDFVGDCLRGSLRPLLITPLVLGCLPAIAVFVAYLLWWFLKNAVSFTWNLIKMVHSDKRVLCAVDSIIAVAVTFLWFIQPEMTTVQKVTMVLFGGLIGAGFGIFSWEVISRRILHIDRQKTSEVEV